MELKRFDFTKEGRELAQLEPRGKDWPVVYLINNDKKLYIGETNSFSNRFAQHLDAKEKRGLKNIYAIFDEEFNKSAILDIEQYLIRLCSADGKYMLLNGNAGQSATHNYYQREKYLNKLDSSESDIGIWKRLQENGLADKSFSEIVNSDIFTYSPYTSLTVEQEEVCYSVLDDILNGLEEKPLLSPNGTTCVINGGAGTGKTILGIYMSCLINNANAQEIDFYKDEESVEASALKQSVLHKIKKYIDKHGKLTFAYVLPMVSIRKTIKKVFSNSKNGLKANMVIGPFDITKDKYDIVLVDESHRLFKRKNIMNIGAYDGVCDKLGMDKYTCNSLDWIVGQSRARVLFYDKDQTVKGSDISPEEFRHSIEDTETHEYTLNTQMRCNGGKEYIEYLNNLFNCVEQPIFESDKYEVATFNDPNKMIEKIKNLNGETGLCRTVAGYAWKWVSKDKSKEEIEATDSYDIRLGDKKYYWNMSNEEWILRPSSIDEIGCIHTVQGYDLNYVGVIFGKEIDYDPVFNQIVVDTDKFFDVNVKKGCSPTEVKKYIVNAYKVMMERGIKGCFVSACNKNLAEYFKKFFAEVK